MADLDARCPGCVALHGFDGRGKRLNQPSYCEMLRSIITIGRGRGRHGETIAIYWTNLVTRVVGADVEGRLENFQPFMANNEQSSTPDWVVLKEQSQRGMFFVR